MSEAAMAGQAALLVFASLAGALGGVAAALGVRVIERRRARAELARLVADTARHVEDTARMLADSRARLLAALRRESIAVRREVGH